MVKNSKTINSYIAKILSPHLVSCLSRFHSAWVSTVLSFSRVFLKFCWILRVSYQIQNQVTALETMAAGWLVK